MVGISRQRRELDIVDNVLVACSSICPTGALQHIVLDMKHVYVYSVEATRLLSLNGIFGGFKKDFNINHYVTNS